MFSAIPVHSIVPHCPIPGCQKLFSCANPHFEKGPGLRVYIRPCSRTEKLVPLLQTEDQTNCKNGSDSDQRTCGRLFCCLCPGLSQHHVFIVLSWLAAVLHCRRRNDTVDGVSFLFYPKNNASGGGGGIFCPRIFQVYTHCA